MDFPAPYIYQPRSGSIIPVEKLSDYATPNGVVIPQTSEIRRTIENMMRQIFGSDLNIDPETPVGRLVEALTFMFVDTLGVNAQNANNFNPENAIGSYLDSLGKLWNVGRFEGESDSDYRNRILRSQSRGNGFTESVRQSISQIVGVGGCVVLNNGHKEVAVHDGVRVSGHSIYACVDCEDDDDVKLDVANAIMRSISAGCGCTEIDDEGNGTRVPESGSTPTGWPEGIVFYMPDPVNISIFAKVKSGSYTGTDIASDAELVIRNYLGSHKMNSTIYSTEIIAELASTSGIVCTGFDIYIDEDTSTPVDSVIINPSQVLRIAAGAIHVSA